MRSLTLRSPAKTNLYLKVLRKRPDGYHEISTIFQRIDLSDDITFTPDPRNIIRITCNNPQIPLGPKNLVYKAAAMIKAKYGISSGLLIKIHKRIPVAAGLAGGSSNAATTLLGVNQVWKLRLSQKELMGYARSIGSDVPFFLHNASWAWGKERGDKIKKLNLGSKLWQVIVTPRLKLLSGKIYGGLNLKLTKSGDNASILIHYIRNNSILGISKRLYNDLETVILQQYPQVKRLKERLKSLGAKGVMVSGSGPSVFALTDNEAAAKDIYKQISRQYSQVFVVRTL